MPQSSPRDERSADMDLPLPVIQPDDATASSAIWDWDDLLDFNISFDSDDLLSPFPSVEHQSGAPVPDRVRKRDPRLTCSNFLAGRVPCACPEIDEKLEEEEAARIGAPGKKRARTVRVGGRARCQVPDCEADISELKGYHRRHRVCLRCANASVVMLDGQNKRYCQQCGKFHVLPDFDEGKRSCRRKLERHNNRRRRKPADSKGGNKEAQEPLQFEDITFDPDAGKDGICLSSELAEQEATLESEDGPASTLKAAPALQNGSSDNTVSVVVSGDTEVEGGKDDFIFSLSPCCDNKTAYSSMCPTGRISFKLYDWNPAEFPRRLRHQIFQWLANMPVELEGYIRPGCTILTIFISMPKGMWMKLSENPVHSLHDFVHTPGRMLYGRGFMTVYLNDLIFRTRRDGTSLMKINVKTGAPRLHFVHPSFFDAGKPMEFIACGSNLMQTKFRFLVSFDGKYLAYDYCATPSNIQTKGDPACKHELCKIRVPHTEPNVFGPALIEVENESGLSNFIPVLIGDTEICSEMKSIQKKFDHLLFSEGSQISRSMSLSEKCEALTLRHAAFSEFVLDVAWLLKMPTLENFQYTTISSQIQRLDCVLNFLIQNESAIILKKILQNLKIMRDKLALDSATNNMNDNHLRLLEKYIRTVTDSLNLKLQRMESSIVSSGFSEGECCHGGSENYEMTVVSLNNQDLQVKTEGELEVTRLNVFGRNGTLPLLNKEVVMNVQPRKYWQRKTCTPIFSTTGTRYRPTVFVVTLAAVCLAICAVFLHPQKAVEFAVTVRVHLFKKS